jgi:DNA helicase II / ATP-dependent DNA helicase PcrA
LSWTKITAVPKPSSTLRIKRSSTTIPTASNPSSTSPKSSKAPVLPSPPSPQKIPGQTLPLEHEIGIFEAPTLEDEVDWTIKTIVDLVTVKGLSYKDIAILARANNHLEPYISALKRAGLPYQLVANSGLFDQDEIKTLILFLKVLLDPSDAINLIQLSQSHIFNLSDPLMFAALKTAKQKSTSVWQEIQVIHEEPVAHFIKTILDYQQLAAETPVTELLYRFIEATGYIKPWVQVESVDNQLKIKNLNLFFNHLKRFEATTNDKTIVGFLSVLDLWLEAGENPGQAQIEDIDTITLLTIHSAKGLEFEAVFVCSLITGRFPTTNRRDPIMVPNELIKETLPTGDEHIGEERRLFYVALTRAKQYLYLTFSKDIGGVRKRHPSGFLTETGLPHQTITPPTEPLPLQLVPAIDPKVRFIKQGQYVIDKVSYSQIDTFKACPLKYKYRYLLQIPAKPHHSLSFGRTIHSTLHQFHASEMQGKNLSLEELLSLYDQNFIEDGYDSSEHKKQRYDSGKQALTRYYHAYQKALGKPQLLEQAFRLKLNGVTLVGKIDRIDTNQAGEYEIVDYKTGTHKDQKKVDKDDQLTLYTLAAKEALGLDIQNASLYFLENGGHKVTTTRTPEQVAKAREKLLKDIDVMQTSEFPAKPDPVKCGFCEFSSLCPFAATKKV